jgi:predicted transcriptional regulator
LGRDLWSSLEQRLKKQDERILDMMGRVEVIQSRVMASPPPQTAASGLAPPVSASPAPQMGAEPPENHIETSLPQRPESHESQPSREPAPGSAAETELDETQLGALKLLSGAPMNTRQLTDALRKSREHTARIMKELFELGLVQRNASTKPFVYELTNSGRSLLPKS